MQRKLLGVERLEIREMMYATAALRDGTLTIEADRSGGEVDVSVRTGSLLVTSPDSRTRAFRAADVQRVVFLGSNEVDNFENHTSIASTIYGRGGNDVLIGGAGPDRIDGGRGADYLWGNAGRDRIWGGPDDSRDIIGGGAGDDEIHGGGGDDTLLGDGGVGLAFFVNETGNDAIYGDGGDDYIHGARGNDVLDGGEGRDRIWGEQGDDVIRGENGNDLLYGGDGNDNLYGGTGADSLLGQNGNDGLFGGEGIDVLSGGNGADRFLQHGRDAILDAAFEDATIRFENGVATLAFDNWWAAGRFTDLEIERIDRALAVLHQATGTTHLLERANGGVLTFVRQGAPNDVSSIHGWNTGATVTLVDDSFNDGIDWLHQIVFHEVGHNWDDQRENSTVGAFRRISGWQHLAPGLGIWSSAVQYVPAEDNWWYISTSEFARPYGKTNPFEDFATAFSAYFMDLMGRPYTGSPGPDGIPRKLAYMESFVANLA